MVRPDWSQTYFGNALNDFQHECNNAWFQEKLGQLSDKGMLYVPTLVKSFNKQGEEL
tara:strand:+ start:99 stop:269 length:171 start_codon:yes stop_codon:yes gene_type:complete